MKSSDIPFRIQEACRRLALRHGFYRLTVDELAREAGITKRTLYRYYPSKEEIFAATLDSFMKEVSMDAQNLLQHEKEPAVFIKTMLGVLAQKGQFVINPTGLYDLQKHYPQLWHKIDQFRMERISQIIEALNKKDPSNPAPDINVHIFTAVITASIQAVLNPTFILENNLSFYEAAGQLSELLIGLFKTQPNALIAR